MKAIFAIVFCLLIGSSYAQVGGKIYNPVANVDSTIHKSLIKAKTEKKYLFLQIGGNWCPWCLKFHKLCSQDQEIKTLMDKSFIKILVNYSKENKNLAELQKLEFPQRFGFPVFVILDSNGKRIHTQNSSYLEEGEGYSKKKVIDFLTQWTPDAINPDHFKNK